MAPRGSFVFASALVAITGWAGCTGDLYPTHIGPDAAPDDDPPAIVAEPATVTVTEGATSNLAITLSHEPAGAVTIVVSSDDAAATVSPAELFIAPDQFDAPHTITIEGAADADTLDGSATVTVNSGTVTGTLVPVTVVDADVLNISSSPTSLSLREGGEQGTFEISLTQDPAGGLAVNLSPSTAAVVVAPSTIHFTSASYSTPRAVTVTPVQDDDLRDAVLAVSLTASGLTERSVTIGIADDDTQAIVASEHSLAVAEGEATSFDVRLAYRPLTDHSVAITPSVADAVTVSPPTLTFGSSNYSTPQSVTVVALHDDDAADAQVALDLTAESIDNDTVAVSVTDDDLQAILVDPASVTVAEGGTAEVAVTLAFRPQSATTITAISADPDAFDVSPATLTFGPGNYFVAQTLTVSGLEDANNVSETAPLVLSNPSIDDVSIDVTTEDNDP